MKFILLPPSPLPYPLPPFLQLSRIGSPFRPNLHFLPGMDAMFYGLAYLPQR